MSTISPIPTPPETFPAGASVQIRSVTSSSLTGKILRGPVTLFVDMFGEQYYEVETQGISGYFRTSLLSLSALDSESNEAKSDDSEDNDDEDDKFSRVDDKTGKPSALPD